MGLSVYLVLTIFKSSKEEREKNSPQKEEHKVQKKSQLLLKRRSQKEKKSFSIKKILNQRLMPSLTNRAVLLWLTSFLELLSLKIITNFYIFLINSFFRCMIGVLSKRNKNESDFLYTFFTTESTFRINI